MEKYVLTCCSTSDLPLEYYKEKDLPFICFHYKIDNKEYSDDLGQSMPFDEFYNKMTQGASPTTSQVNEEEYKNFFIPYLEKGLDIIHVCLSSGISGTINSALIAKRDLEELYPERTIYIVDSLGASSGYGLLMDKLVELKNQGYTISQLYNWVEENKLRLNHWFFSLDLTSYKRGGRISATAFILGKVLSIYPLLNMSNEGKLIVRKKVHGKKKLYNEIVDRMESLADKGLEYNGKCFISNSNCIEDAKEVAKLVEKRFPHLNGKVLINSVGTTIGSHTGPGTVALFFFGKKREN